MKRPSSIDSSNSEKMMKFGGGQTSSQNSTPDLSNGQNQAVSYMSNVPPPPTPPMQTQMAAAYYMGASGYYPAVMSTDLASSMYSQYSYDPWQMTAAAATQAAYDTTASQSLYDPTGTQSVFDPSRPPPPPLPTTPAPEKPPPPPLPPSHEKGDISASPSLVNNYYVGHGSYATFNGRGAYRRYGKFKGGPLGSQPPHPGYLNGKASTGTMENAKHNRANARGDNKKKNCPIVHKKKRRKPMSERLPTLEWKREDAQKVLELEKEYHARRGDKAIIVRFPDPRLDYDVVKKFSTSIESVHFQQPAAARSCIVHLKKGSDVKEVVEELNKTPFGLGLLSAEPKRDEIDDGELAVEDIDPYTLYIGNFPSDVNVDEVRAMFKKAKKVDVGYAQKMKVTRYGFARYTNVDDAIEAYKANYNALYKSRSIIVRFRRNNRSIGLDGERSSRKKEDKKQVLAAKAKSTNEETSTENGTVTYENDSDDGEYEVEDTKSGVFDDAHNMMDNWLSDEMYESDYNEDEELPNLTGMIKHEPDEDVCNDLLRAENDDFVPSDILDKSTQVANKEGTNTTRPHRLADSSNDRPNQSSCSSKPLRVNNYWEEVRQRELSEKEEKPDICNLYSPQSSERAPSVPPITKYGLVPMILPKEEQEENDNADDSEGDIDAFGSTFGQDDDKVDAAFESAWNELAA